MSQYNFWDTVKGHHLADVLIQALPQLVKKEQYTKLYSYHESIEELNYLSYLQKDINKELIENKSRVVQIIKKEFASGIEFLVVYEKN